MYSYEGAGACVAVVSSKPKGDVKRWNGGDHSRVERTFGPDFELDGAPVGARDAWDAK